MARLSHWLVRSLAWGCSAGARFGHHQDRRHHDLFGQVGDAAAQMDNGMKLYLREKVRDKVDILVGFMTAPNTLAAADVSSEAKKFLVILKKEIWG